MFIGRTDAETKLQYFGHLMVRANSLERPWCWGDWGQEENGTTEEEKGMTEDDRGWMASPTQWTWVWINSWNWWYTGRPDLLQSLGSRRVGQDWATEQPPPPPMVRAQHSHCTGWILGGETKIPAAANCGKKKKAYSSRLPTLLAIVLTVTQMWLKWHK